MEDMYHTDFLEISHYKILNFFHGKWFEIPELDALEYRIAKFTIRYFPSPMQIHDRGLTIYVPFMRSDHGISIQKGIRSEYTTKDLKERKIYKNTTLRIGFF